MGRKRAFRDHSLGPTKGPGEEDSDSISSYSSSSSEDRRGS